MLSRSPELDWVESICIHYLCLQVQVDDVVIYGQTARQVLKVGCKEYECASMDQLFTYGKCDTKSIMGRCAYRSCTHDRLSDFASIPSTNIFCSSVTLTSTQLINDDETFISNILKDVRGLLHLHCECRCIELDTVIVTYPTE